MLIAPASVCVGVCGRRLFVLIVVIATSKARFIIIISTVRGIFYMREKLPRRTNTSLSIHRI